MKTYTVNITYEVELTMSEIEAENGQEAIQKAKEQVDSGTLFVNAECQSATATED